MTAFKRINVSNHGLNALMPAIEKAFDKTGIPEPDGVDASRATLVTIAEEWNPLITEIERLSGAVEELRRRPFG